MESGAAKTAKPRRMNPSAVLGVAYLAPPGRGFWISTASRRILDIVVAVNALLAMPLVWSGVSKGAAFAAHNRFIQALVPLSFREVSAGSVS
jgi:hypothetical protein